MVCVLIEVTAIKYIKLVIYDLSLFVNIKCSFDIYLSSKHSPEINSVVKQGTTPNSHT